MKTLEETKNTDQGSAVGDGMEAVGSLTDLIESSGLRKDHIYTEMGYKDRSGWKRKVEKVGSWTTDDIYKLSGIINRTPAEIFAVIYEELTSERADEVAKVK